MANKKEYSIVINGIRESIEEVEALLATLSKLETKIDNLQTKTINVGVVQKQQVVTQTTSHSSKDEEVVKNEINEQNIALEKQRQLNKEIKDEIKAIASGAKDIDGNYSNTLAGMRKELASMKKDLAFTEVGTEGFDVLKNKIKELNDKIKDIEQSYGVFGRNVGNYANSIKEAFEDIEGEIDVINGKKIKVQVGDEVREFDSIKLALRNLNNEAKALGVNLDQMRQRGLEGTDEFQKLQNQFNDVSVAADELEHSIARANRALEDIKDDSGSFGQITRSFEAFNDVVQIGVGVSGLFGQSQEEVQKAINRTIQLTTVMNGVQKLLDKTTTSGMIVNKAYSKTLAMVSSAFGVEATSATAAAVATKAFSAALVTTGIGALVVALGAALNYIGDFVGKMIDAADSSKQYELAIERAKNALNDYIATAEKIEDIKADSGMETKLQAVEKTALAVKKAYMDFSVASEKALLNVIGKIENLNEEEKKAYESFKELGTAWAAKTGEELVQTLEKQRAKYIEARAAIEADKNGTKELSNSQKALNQSIVDLYPQLETYIQYLIRLKNTQEQTAQAAAQWANNLEQYQIDAMKDGTAKIRAQYELRAREAKAAAQKQGEELGKTQEEINQTLKAIDAKYNKERADATKQYNEQQQSKAKTHANNLNKVEKDIQTNRIKLMRNGWDKIKAQLDLEEKEAIRQAQQNAVEAKVSEEKKQELVLSVQKVYAKKREETEREYLNKMRQLNIEYAKSVYSMYEGVASQYAEIARNNSELLSFNSEYFTQVADDIIEPLTNSLERLDAQIEDTHLKMMLLGKEMSERHEYKLEVPRESIEQYKKLAEELEALNKERKELFKYEYQTKDNAPDMSSIKRFGNNVVIFFKRIWSDSFNSLNGAEIRKNLEYNLDKSARAIQEWQKVMVESQMNAYQSTATATLKQNNQDLSNVVANLDSQLDVYKKKYDEIEGATKELYDALKAIAEPYYNWINDSTEENAKIFNEASSKLLGVLTKFSKDETAIQSESYKELEKIVDNFNNSWRLTNEIAQQRRLIDEKNNAAKLTEIAKQSSERIIGVYKSQYDQLEDLRDKFNSQPIRTGNYSVDDLGILLKQNIEVNKFRKSYELLNKSVQSQITSNNEVLNQLYKQQESIAQQIGAKKAELAVYEAEANKIKEGNDKLAERKKYLILELSNGESIIEQNKVELELIEKKYKLGEITQKSYELQKKNLEEGTKAVKDRIAMLKDELSKIDIQLLSPDELKKKIEEIKKQLEGLANDAKDIDLQIVNLKSANKQLGSLAQTIKVFLDSSKKNWKKWSTELAELSAVGVEVWAQMYSQISEMQYNNAIYAIEQQQKQLEDEYDLLEDELSKQEDLYSRHNDNVNAIEDKLKDARGDRRLFLLDQLNSEINAREAAWGEEQRINAEKAANEKKQKALDKQKEAEERKRNKAQQRIQLAQAIASTALAVTNALSVQPFYLGLALAALASTMGAVQVATIANTKYADGGLLNGKSHSQGGIPIGNTGIEVEGKEYVVNKQSTAKNLPLIEYINDNRRTLTLEDMADFFSSKQNTKNATFKKTFANGGQLQALQAPDMSVREVVQMYQQDDRPIYVAVTDIENAQKRVRSVRALAGINE